MVHVNESLLWIVDWAINAQQLSPRAVATKRLKNMKVLVTGVAGFIGFHLTQRLLSDGHQVIGLDNFNAYYDVALKEARWAQLDPYKAFVGVRGDLVDQGLILGLFDKHKPDVVINMAAQAGVRYSIEQPRAYIDSNISGFLNLLEAARAYPLKHFIYASSSSVYGANRKLPFAVTDPVDHPISLYAATKKSNELMAHTYAALFNIPLTGLRFFTVYGPWGRPDMALFKFLKRMISGYPIDIYNHGDMARDFTYVDDIVEAIVRLIPKAPAPNPYFDPVNPTPDASFAPYALHNIGRSEPEKLMDVVVALEEASGITAIKNFMDMQPGDVKETHADVASLEAVTGYRPQVTITEGMKAFVDWYKDFYHS